MNLFWAFSFPDNSFLRIAYTAATTGQPPSGLEQPMDFGALVFSGLVTVAVIFLALVYSRWSFKKMRRMNNTPIKRYSYRDFDGLIGFTPPPDGAQLLPGNHGKKITAAIRESHPDFDEETFLSFAEQTFRALQHARCLRSMDEIAEILHADLLRRYEAEAQSNREAAQIPVLEPVSIRHLWCHLLIRDAVSETLSVYLAAEIPAMLTNEKTGSLVSGSPDEPDYLHYLLNFERADGQTGWILRSLTSLKDFTSLDERGVVEY